MSVYNVQFVEGGSAEAPGGGLNFIGIHRLLQVQAPSRADALIAAYSRLCSRGEVTVLGFREGDSQPLGFSEQEQDAVRSAGVPLTVGYPRAGCQIERVYGECPPARMGVSLEGIPGLVFTSWEADVAGQWTIYYGTDLLNAHTTWCVLESEGTGLVGQARERFLESSARGSFDLDNARRDAADRVVVSKIRQTLEHLHLQPADLV